MWRYLLAAALVAASFIGGAVSVSRKTFPYTLWTSVRGYDDGMGAYRRERAAFFDSFSRPADVVMVGDSIIADVDWREALPGVSVANRGIRGDTTSDVLARIHSVLSPHPRQIVLMIGVNDLDNGDSPQEVAGRYRQIVDRLRPHAEVIAVSVLPCSSKAEKCARLTPRIHELNRLIAQIPGAAFVDVTPRMSASETMRDDFTYDGIHLNVAGFRALLAGIEPHIRRGRPQVSQAALPAPQS